MLHERRLLTAGPHGVREETQLGAGPAGGLGDAGTTCRECTGASVGLGWRWRASAGLKNRAGDRMRSRGAKHNLDGPCCSHRPHTLAQGGPLIAEHCVSSVGAPTHRAMPPHTVDPRSRELVEGPSRVVLTGAVNPMADAAAERRRATFNSDELAAFLHDGKDNLKRR